MRSWYGFFQLDPHLIASIRFRRRLKSVRTYILLGDESSIGPIPSRSELFYRVLHGGCGTTWVIYTVVSVPSAINIKRVTYMFDMVDGHTIAVSIELDVRITAGTYMIIYSTCIRSFEPLLMTLSR